MHRIRVLIVDDHNIVRDGIRALIALAGDIEVIGEAANGREALEKAKALSPDVVLMDLAMPAMGGLEATRRILRESPEIKVLVLTQYDDKDYVIPIIEAGASGFLSKVAGASELVSGIRAVHQGSSFLSPSVAKVLIDDYQQLTAGRDRGDPYGRLTDREREVFKLVAEGRTSQEIADLLVISVKTVEGYKTNLMSKLDLHNRTELIKYALRRGIITA